MAVVGVVASVAVVCVAFVVVCMGCVHMAWAGTTLIGVPNMVAWGTLVGTCLAEGTCMSDTVATDVSMAFAVDAWVDTCVGKCLALVAGLWVDMVVGMAPGVIAWCNCIVVFVYCQLGVYSLEACMVLVPFSYCQTFWFCNIV